MKTQVRSAMLLAAMLCTAAVAIPAHADTEAGTQVSLNTPFDPQTQRYSATVGHDVTEIVVNVRPSDPKARVTVNGGTRTSRWRLRWG